MRQYLFGFLLSVILLPLQVFAKDHKQIEDNLKKNFPQLTIEDISASPIPGLSQVIASGNILYATQDGRYIIAGDLIDLQNGQHNLSEGARKASRLKSLNSVEEKNMLIFAAKKPEYVVTVFTDVDCGYCRKLHAEMSKLNDLGITVRYLAFPRAGENSATAEKMSKIWCAKNKQQAFNDASNDKAVEGSVCPDRSVARGYELGQAIGINGTPTLVFEDGTVFPGYLPPEKLLEAAKQIHAQAKK